MDAGRPRRPERIARAACGRKWLGPADARCLLAGKDVLFMGNSVVRRQMYTLLDLLAGPRAHRQLRDFSSVQLPDPNVDVEKVKRSWVWDRDNETFAYHGAQLVTVDLTTGEHRFTMPHVTCGLGDKYQVFNRRLNQWRNPGSGGGTEEIGANWKSSKWFSREWRPVVSMELELPPPGRGADLCAARQVALAGASDDGVAAWPPSPPPTDVLAERRRRPRRRAGVGAAIRDRLIQEVRAHFADTAADVDGWLMNVTVHVETGGLRGAAAGGAPRRRRGEAANPNVWVYFRRTTASASTSTASARTRWAPASRACTQSWRAATSTPSAAAATSACRCRRRRACGSTARARLRRRSAPRARCSTYAAARVATTPFYDDCWDNRGRCQDGRAASPSTTCTRAAPPRCSAAAPGRTAGRPSSRRRRRGSRAGAPPRRCCTCSTARPRRCRPRPSARGGRRRSATARTPSSSARSLQVPRPRRVEAQARRRPRRPPPRRRVPRPQDLVLFRSPAFNFDPMNTPAQQAAFSAQMRPLVEEAGFVYVDNYAATYEAVFQETPHAIKFAMNSAFHYLNAGRYLMAQLVLGAFQLLAPSS